MSDSNYSNRRGKKTQQSAVASSGLPRRRIFVYLSALIILVAFGSPAGGLIDVPVSFILKNKLHLRSSDVAYFRLATGIPFYFSPVFGFIRDRWNPFGMRGRALLIIFGATSSILYAVFATIPISYVDLMVSVVFLTVSFLFVDVAMNGLISTIGQRHSISGEVSAIWNIVLVLTTIASLLIGGTLSDFLESAKASHSTQTLFLLGAAIMAAIAIFGTLHPEGVIAVQPDPIPKSSPLSDIRRLARHIPIYPALLITFLWNFSPGSATPLQYFLQNVLHSSDFLWGQWNAIYDASFLPTHCLFWILCRRISLKKLLVWSSLIAIAQMVPLLFIHSVSEALIAAVPAGLMGGMATSAYLSLIIRSCPSGLQGTMLMLSGSLYAVAVRAGDLWGTYLYETYDGFPACVAAITLVNALILPALSLIPSHVTSLADGEQALEKASGKSI